MAFVENVLALIPEPVRAILVRHRELLKFAVVGGICFIVTITVNYVLKFTVLNRNPVTAQAVAVIVATIASYVLNREWSFRERGGRERRHEAALFFLISGIGVGINSLPLFVSRYVLDLQVPNVTLITQEVADFGFGIVLGTALAMVFRWWAFKKWVFPDAEARVRPLRAVRPDSDTERAA
ncbi:GtrA family protein [Actinokineospora sp. PR83]|uniref:GtrA family protein n=1 Tax=Actinokineospora sp. PR83 TaxID=2884908 RepID=UPI001F396D6D|nr:GtrA family protein [Actinokineospora sp. PR83]MCG8920106.1 GtrA family protein [Actinokineospora sp. PR83]